VINLNSIPQSFYLFLKENKGEHKREGMSKNSELKRKREGGRTKKIEYKERT